MHLIQNITFEDRERVLHKRRCHLRAHALSNVHGRPVVDSRVDGTLSDLLRRHISLTAFRQHSTTSSWLSLTGRLRCADS